MNKILCAAIWYKELKTATYLPKNIHTGVVVGGYRHHDIISTVLALTGKRTVLKGKNSVGEYVQGFITSDNRFVDREEGFKIATKADQIIQKLYSRTSLYSEDLY